MKEETVFELLHHGEPLVTEIPASNDGKSAWLGVYPLDLKKRGTATALCQFGVSMLSTEGPFYRVRAFEVDRALIDADVWVSEVELSNCRDVLAIGDNDLRAKLAQFGIRLDDLDLPSESDYPI